MQDVTFVRSEPITKNITTFWFKPTRPIRYIAGQFIELHIPHDNVDSRGDKRWFTLSSSPTDSMLSITTKLAANQSSSFKRALQTIKPGTKLKIMSPMGDFVLPKDPGIPLLFVAVGIGCTPFHSIIEFLEDTNQTRDITLLYNARERDEIIFQDTFSKLGKKFTTSIKRITSETILSTLAGSTQQHVYISGPETTVELLSKELERAGYPISHIRVDFFHGYIDP